MTEKLYLCSTCKIFKSPDDFWKDKRNKSRGFCVYQCKACHRIVACLRTSRHQSQKEKKQALAPVFNTLSNPFTCINNKGDAGVFVDMGEEGLKLEIRKADADPDELSAFLIPAFVARALADVELHKWLQSINCMQEK